jgi:CcmD family protein
MVNGYLVAAYGVVWAIFMVYSWTIRRREQQLEKEIKDLKKSLGQ